MPNIHDSFRFLHNAATVRRPAFNVIHRVQDFTPGEQILGTAVALTAICDAAGLPLSEVLTKAARIMHDAEGPFTSHIRAIREYAKGEFTG